MTVTRTVQPKDLSKKAHSNKTVPPKRPRRRAGLQRNVAKEETTTNERNIQPDNHLDVSTLQHNQAMPGNHNHSYRLIQPWHVVLGDTQSGGRKRGKTTTRATDLLRHVKQEFKAQHTGKARKGWIPAAKREFERRVRQEFGHLWQGKNDNSNNNEDSLGLVLIKCTPKALESGRVAQPFTHGYAGDSEALYGIAKLPFALDFFLTSRDAPTLKRDLATHTANLRALRSRFGNHKAPLLSSPPSQQTALLLLDDFNETLRFFSHKLTLAEKGNVLAERLLASMF